MPRAHKRRKLTPCSDAAAPSTVESATDAIARIVENCILAGGAEEQAQEAVGSRGLLKLGGRAEWADLLLQCLPRLPFIQVQHLLIPSYGALHALIPGSAPEIR